MPKSPCLEPKCGAFSTYRGRCQRHAKQRNRETTSANKKVYNSKRWKLLRRRVLFEESLCRVCGDIATDVDHIVPIQDGGEPYSRANCQALCAKHHGEKTRQEQHGRHRNP